jgi:membrane fusion protein, multidrug efflux system
MPAGFCFKCNRLMPRQTPARNSAWRLSSQFDTAADRLANMQKEQNSPALPGVAAIQKRRRRRGVVTFVAAVMLILAVAGGLHYWRYARFIISTDDAYAQADSTILASRVSGYVSVVQVQDDEHVKAGQILARIDDRDYCATLDQARADVQAAKAAETNLEAQLVQQDALIARARASVAASQAALDLARIDRARAEKMAGIGFGSQQQSQQADAHAREQVADLQRDRAALTTAEREVDVLRAKLGQAHALSERSQAVERRAELDVEYTTIIAPIDGTVGARSLRVGQYVQAGTQLLAIVPLRDVYIIANFKETQLTHARTGQHVRLRVDTFPGVDLRGYVDNLAPATGLEFSLLPPDNATGNFTKIVQRVPVKIRLDASQPLLGQLRPGMSVEAYIDTRPAAAGRSVALAER